MAATQSVVSFGVKIQMEEPVGSGTYQDVAEILDIDGPDFTRNMLEATHHQSPNYWDEFRKGKKTLGSLSGECNYLIDDTTHDSDTGMLSDFSDDDNMRLWRFLIDTGVYIQARGAVAKFSLKAGMIDGIRRASFEIKLSGEPTFVGL